MFASCLAWHTANADPCCEAGPYSNITFWRLTAAGRNSWDGKLGNMMQCAEPGQGERREEGYTDALWLVDATE